MKKIIVFIFLFAIITTSVIGLSSCKKKSDEGSKNQNDDISNNNFDNSDNEGSNDNEELDLLPSTEGLEFKLSPNGKYYELISIGTCTKTDIIVDSYNGLPVAVIGYASFMNNSTIKSVTFGDNVKTISTSAFEKASALASVKIGKSVGYIGSDAFFGCVSLTDVVIESNVLTSLGLRAFMNCSKLKNINIPSSVTEFGENLFDACYEINFNVYGNAKYIGNNIDKFIYLFKATSRDVTSVNIPNGVKAIGDTAFFDCKQLNTVVIPDSVTYVGSSAFEGCSALTSVKLGNSVSIIGQRAFASCSMLKNINMPSSITSVESCAFSNCNNIEATEYENAKYLGSQENKYYYLLSAKSTSVTDVIVHKDTVMIGTNAFSNCTLLQTVNLPDGLKYIGDSAFRNCSALSNIDIPSSVVEIDSAFVGCKSLKSITLPDGITYLFPHLFSGCEALESVSVSSSIIYISSDVFANCSSLKSIIFRGTVEQWEKLPKSGTWNEGTGDYKIICNDGTVNK